MGNKWSNAAVVQVTPSTTQDTILQVGQTIVVSVAASVGNPQDNSDGIFTFDQNLILAAIPSGQPLPLEVLSVSRPGVDDALYGGSNGTSASTGVNDIYGGYDGMSEGIGSPVTLYTVTLEAISPGSAVVSSGPSVDPYGFDFTLNETASPSVDYAAGPTITVIALPEPAAAAGMIGLAAYVCGMRGRRERSLGCMD
jgi:hypothetical protein